MQDLEDLDLGLEDEMEEEEDFEGLQSISSPNENIKMTKR
jgi:hypothetical protein